MKKIIIILFLLAPALLGAQGLHFSQFYNAPILLNPANTGLLAESDWRAGVQYRSQWLTVPVPYNTFSAFADFALMRNGDGGWLGTGLAMWRDAAGNGDLALTKVQGNIAYHIEMNEYGTLSGGLGVAYTQRSVDLSKLTFEAQWDEFAFNTSAPNNENYANQKTNFLDLSAGLNYSFFNQNDLYIQMSIGAMHINRPLESFYGETNRLGIRPLGHLNAIIKASNSLIINPSIYYTRQKKAQELLIGSLVNLNVSGGGPSLHSNQFIVGAYTRFADAIIGAMGYQWKQNKFMVSYDHTISSLSRGNNGLGGIEFSLIMQGGYNNDSDQSYNCPRF